MTDDLSSRKRARVIAALRELIDALDRRIPQIERAAELQIATDAARLKAEAIARIEELRQDTPASPRGTGSAGRGPA